MVTKMTSLFLHPALPLIIAAICSGVTNGYVQKFFRLIGPIVGLVFLFQMPVGSAVSLPFINDYLLYPIMVDKLGFLFAAAIIGITFFANIYALNDDSKIESASSMFYSAASVCIAICGDLVSFIFAWELMTVTALLLIWNKSRPSSIAPGFRYLMVHMFGGNLMLAGILFKIFTDGNILISSLSERQDIGFWLIVIAVSINAAVVPVHAWLVDAYPNSSLSGIVYLNSFTTKIAVFAMIRFFAGVDFFIWAGVFMAIYGACFAIIENNFRKLLSYHIISQVGFMVAAVGIGNHMAINGAAIHTVNNILYKSLLFMCAGAIIYSTGKTKISQLGGLYKRLPIIAVCFAIAAFSIAGVPLFAGFISKPMIGEAAIEAGMPLIATLLNIAGIGTVLSIPCKMGYFMFFAKPDNEFECKPIPKNMIAAIIALSIACILIGIFPDIVYNYLPFENTYHPYDIHIVLEYLQILPAAAIPFIVLRKKMAPHSAITLDTDWFYRKPLPAIISFISKIIINIQQFFGKLGYAIYSRSLNAFSYKSHSYYRLFERVPIGDIIVIIWLALLVIFISIIIPVFINLKPP